MVCFTLAVQSILPYSPVGTPIAIPASPFMQKLGCGTGVNVYLMKRYVRYNGTFNLASEMTSCYVWFWRYGIFCFSSLSSIANVEINITHTNVFNGVNMTKL